VSAGGYGTVVDAEVVETPRGVELSRDAGVYAA
jgi:hypothetical protein